MSKVSNDLRLFMEQEEEMPADIVQVVVNMVAKLQAGLDYLNGVKEELRVRSQNNAQLIKYMPDAKRGEAELHKAAIAMTNVQKDLLEAQRKMQAEYGAAARAIKPDQDYPVGK